jgi:hypothetical protein
MKYNYIIYRLYEKFSQCSYNVLVFFFSFPGARFNPGSCSTFCSHASIVYFDLECLFRFCVFQDIDKFWLCQMFPGVMWGIDFCRIITGVIHTSQSIAQ